MSRSGTRTPTAPGRLSVRDSAFGTTSERLLRRCECRPVTISFRKDSCQHDLLHLRRQPYSSGPLMGDHLVRVFVVILDAFFIFGGLVIALLAASCLFGWRASHERRPAVRPQDRQCLTGNKNMTRKNSLITDEMVDAYISGLREACRRAYSPRFGRDAMSGSGNSVAWNDYAHRHSYSTPCHEAKVVGEQNHAQTYTECTFQGCDAVLVRCSCGNEYWV